MALMIYRYTKKFGHILPPEAIQAGRAGGKEEGRERGREGGREGRAVA
jgi:predicted transposase YdaD